MWDSVQRERAVAKVAKQIDPLIPTLDTEDPVLARELAEVTGYHQSSVAEAVAYLRDHPSPGSMPLIASPEGYRRSLDPVYNAEHHAYTKKRILTWMIRNREVLKQFLDGAGVNPVTAAAILKSTDRLIEDLRDIPVTV